jgi:hypothetical protein
MYVHVFIVRIDGERVGKRLNLRCLLHAKLQIEHITAVL